MLERIIAGSIRNRSIVLLVAAAVAIAGYFALQRIPVDALPDLSDVQVILYTEVPGQSPQVVEDQVTFPLTTALLSVPRAQAIRGYSFFGVSFVYVVFEDGTDLYWGRSRVLEQLATVDNQLPGGIAPVLGPDATGVGWVFEYVLDGGDQYDLQQLRSLQDWYVRYELSSVPGVAEVASIGGYVKQYQVEVDPVKLAAYNLPVAAVRAALVRGNRDVGGGLVEMGEKEYMVRGLGYIRSTRDIEDTAIGVDENGTPILIRSVANVQTGPALRRGIADWNGDGETVGGIVVMRQGENALDVIAGVKEKLAELAFGLPEGVTIKAAYDRSGLIHDAARHLQLKLIEECIIVAFVVLLFLLHLRSSLVVILSLPMALLTAFLVMDLQNLSANIMSLSGIAIAIGAMVDAAMVMVENAHKHLECKENQLESRWVTMQRAAQEVGPALFWSLLIITVSFLPVFTLEAQEGRLFKPLAYTKTWAMAASALMAVTVVPALMGILIRGRIRPERKNPVSRVLIAIYRPLVRAAVRHRWWVLGAAALVTVSMAIPVSRMGSEFMPPLREGALLYMPTTDPGISIAKAREILQQTDAIIREFPEVEHVFGKAGRAETATDPAPLSMLETTIVLKPPSEWRSGMTEAKLIEQMDAAISIPGLVNAWTMPIRARLDMLSTGIKTPVGIGIMGPDLATLEHLASEAAALLEEIPGTASVFAEKAVGGSFLDFTVRRLEAARYGLNVDDIQQIIQTAVGGVNVTHTVEGLERYPVNVRYSRELRDNIPALERVLITTPSGAQIPLRYVADLSISDGPAVIKSENGRQIAWVYVDVRGTDVGTYVAQAKAALSEQFQLPDGYSLAWGGQFTHIERAARRLGLVIPVTLMIIIVLLYMTFRNFTASLIVLLSVPLALTGGIWMVYLMGYDFSVAVAIGLIALVGVAAETGVVMILYLEQAWHRASSRVNVYRVVLEGAVSRVRPKMMTVLAIIAGLLPIMWSTGTGSAMMKRIAAPMVGGMVTSVLLTLLVIPAIYYIWRRRTLRSAPGQPVDVT